MMLSSLRRSSRAHTSTAFSWSGNLFGRSVWGEGWRQLGQGVDAVGLVHQNDSISNCATPNAPSCVNKAFSQARSFASGNGMPTATSNPPPPTHKEISAPQDFAQLVTLSKSIPIIIDAYAVWCGPCKQLDPVLCKAVEKQQGKIVLAKMDIDSPSLAPLTQQLQITSVPTLFLLIGGRIVDIKTGVPPPSELDEWINKAIQLAQAVQQAAMGTQRESDVGGGGDPKEAVRQGFEAIKRATPLEMIAPTFAGVLQSPGVDPITKAEATAGLAYCALKEGDIDTAKDLLHNSRSLLKQDEPVPEKVEMVGAVLELTEEGVAREMRVGTLNDSILDQLRGKIEKDPKDLIARYDLALCLWISDRKEEAVDQAMHLVRLDRNWNDQAGKQLLLRMGSAFGDSSEEGKSIRRRLSNVWFI